jgi:hypothetical protein
MHKKCLPCTIQLVLPFQETVESPVHLFKSYLILNNLVNRRLVFLVIVQNSCLPLQGTNFLPRLFINQDHTRIEVGRKVQPKERYLPENRGLDARPDIRIGIQYWNSVETRCFVAL